MPPRREQKKLLVKGEVSVSALTFGRLQAAAYEQGKSVNLVADEAINRALDALGVSK